MSRAVRRQGSRAAAATLVALAGALPAGCCDCPPPRHPGSAEACVEPAPPGPGDRPPSDPSSSVEPDPGRRAVAATAPASLEDLVASVPADRSPASYREAVERSLGATVRWALRSWGGEVSSDGYETPAGRQPPSMRGVEMGRIRFISQSLGADADLGAVFDERHPVVACLARFPRGGPPLFVRTDDRSEPAPGLDVVVVEGTLWGVLDEGPSVTIWLRDCAVVDPP